MIIFIYMKIQFINLFYLFFNNLKCKVFSFKTKNNNLIKKNYKYFIKLENILVGTIDENGGFIYQIKEEKK